MERQFSKPWVCHVTTHIWLCCVFSEHLRNINTVYSSKPSKECCIFVDREKKRSNFERDEGKRWNTQLSRLKHRPRTCSAWWRMTGTCQRDVWANRRSTHQTGKRINLPRAFNTITLKSTGVCVCLGKRKLRIVYTKTNEKFWEVIKGNRQVETQPITGARNTIA